MRKYTQADKKKYQEERKIKINDKNNKKTDGILEKVYERLGVGFMNCMVIWIKMNEGCLGDLFSWKKEELA